MKLKLLLVISLVNLKMDNKIIKKFKDYKIFFDEEIINQSFSYSEEVKKKHVWI